MRRMYGDMESTSVYRQMRSAMSEEFESEKPDPEKNPEKNPESDRSVTLGSSFMPDLFSSLEYNIRMGSGLATVQSAKEPVSNFAIKYDLRNDFLFYIRKFWEDVLQLATHQ